MKETLEKVESAELERSAPRSKPSRPGSAKLGSDEALGDFSQEDYTAVLERIFSTRGKRPRKALEEVRVRGRCATGSASCCTAPRTRARFQAFVDPDVLGCGVVRTCAPDFASELLHFTDPERLLALDALDVGPAHAHRLAAAGDHVRLRLHGRERRRGLPEGRAGIVAFVHEVGPPRASRRSAGASSAPTSSCAASTWSTPTRSCACA